MIPFEHLRAAIRRAFSVRHTTNKKLHSRMSAALLTLAAVVRARRHACAGTPLFGSFRIVRRTVGLNGRRMPPQSLAPLFSTNKECALSTTSGY